MAQTVVGADACFDYRHESNYIQHFVLNQAHISSALIYIHSSYFIALTQIFIRAECSVLMKQLVTRKYRNKLTIALR